jgi:hypothetical protein
MADNEPPIITAPGDQVITYGDAGISITWVIHDTLVDPLNTPTYHIHQNTVEIVAPTAIVAINTTVTLDVSALSLAAGTYVFQISATDGINAAVTDSVTIYVNATSVGLADEIYAELNTHWDVAIIAKPTFHRNTHVTDFPKPRHCVINAKMEGTLAGHVHDNSQDIRTIPFIIALGEASENLCIQSMKAIKKVLHREFPTGGHYHIDTFLFEEAQKVCHLTIKGHQFKLIEDDAF